MNIQEYADKAITTLSDNYDYGDISPQLMGQVLGLAGESGEVVEKIKKLLRDKRGMLEESDKADILRELGDVLWYVNAVAHLLGSSLEDVARLNNEKLLSYTAAVIIAKRPVWRRVVVPNGQWCQHPCTRPVYQRQVRR